MSTSVEYTVEIDRIELPTGRNGRYVFVQAGYEGDMSRARFGRDASMGDTKGGMLLDAGA